MSGEKPAGSPGRPALVELGGSLLRVEYLAAPFDQFTQS